MKRITAMLLAIICTVCLCACSKSNSKAPTSPRQNATQSKPTQATTSPNTTTSTENQLVGAWIAKGDSASHIMIFNSDSSFVSLYAGKFNYPDDRNDYEDYYAFLPLFSGVYELQNGSIHVQGIDEPGDLDEYAEYTFLFELEGDTLYLDEDGDVIQFSRMNTPDHRTNSVSGTWEVFEVDHFLLSSITGKQITFENSNIFSVDGVQVGSYNLCDTGFFGLNYDKGTFYTDADPSIEMSFEVLGCGIMVAYTNYYTNFYGYILIAA